LPVVHDRWNAGWRPLGVAKLLHQRLARWRVRIESRLLCRNVGFHDALILQRALILGVDVCRIQPRAVDFLRTRARLSQAPEGAQHSKRASWRAPYRTGAPSGTLEAADQVQCASGSRENHRPTAKTAKAASQTHDGRPAAALSADVAREPTESATTFGSLAIGSR
jgi:hypothetical protein